MVESGALASKVAPQLMILTPALPFNAVLVSPVMFHSFTELSSVVRIIFFASNYIKLN
jgi:hypothetical protein